MDYPDNGITEINQNNKKVIQSKYNSYVASFGGSIIQSGLLATLMIFEANKEKRKIIETLVNLYNETVDDDKLTKSDDFFYKTLESKEESQVKLIRNSLIDMAVSLKLAMRCYEQVDNSNS
ncbi:MAG: hypothetical protein IPJ51_21300 [Saprospiraceae bacterium]|nr:hypothetical protein [Saprospiraceae bacterium]